MFEQINLTDLYTGVTALGGVAVGFAGVVVATRGSRIKNMIIEVKNDMLGIKSAIHRNHTDNETDHKRIFKHIDKSNEILGEIIIAKDINSSIELVISNALAFCNNDELLMSFVEFRGKILKEFTKDILDAGFDKITIREIKAKREVYLQEIVEWCSKLDVELAELISSDIRRKSNRYLEDIISIKRDIINNKLDRFRDVTKVFLQDEISCLINKYNKYNGSNRN